jgi:hypothetical protein
MQSKNRYSFLIVSLLVVALFYSTNMFHSAVALSTHDIMALNANAQVLASRISLSMDNDTEQKDISGTNDTDSDSNNSDPFSTKDNGKIDKDSQIVIEDQDKRDQRNKSSTTKNIVDSCEEDDKRCRNVQDVLRSQDNSENEEDDKDISDQDTNNEEGAEADEDSDNESDEKKSSDKFELPIDIPFP